MPSISIMAAHLQTFRNVTFEIYPHIAAFAAVRVLARALKHAPRRLHRIGSAVKNRIPPTTNRFLATKPLINCW